ncbi:MAG: tetratricopeptide repeat protein [Candidatus Kapaibacterium sp.]
MSKTNELRLFISSTFRDLGEEREHLVKKIFPEIRALCRERGVTFTDVDLRWGLTEEQATLGTVIRTCLEEVDRCRPFFIGMLGSRYGWVPELHEILMDPQLLSSFPFIEDLVLEGASVTEMEFVHGVFNAVGSNVSAPSFYHRPGSLDEADAPEQLATLIERCRATGYPFRTFESVEELGEMVRADLVAIINRDWPIEEALDELETEDRAHRAFAASRTRAYIPNPTYLQAFNRWIAEGETPLVVRGESGLGKSSLVSFLTDYYRRKNPESLVIEHYVGSSEQGGTPRAVMRHLIAGIQKQFGIAEEIPSGGPALERSFSGWLLRAEHLAEEARTPILLVVDALNQLHGTGSNLGWLPRQIPRGIKLLLSTTPSEIGDLLSERDWQELMVSPVEDVRVRQSIVVRYLSEFHKGIAPDNLRQITDDPLASWPLFLRVVAEELRLHGDHDTLANEIGRYLGLPTLHDLFEQVLIRMEEDFGSEVMRQFFSTLALSRFGLKEEDILNLSPLNRLTLSHILFSLDYHLLRRDGRLGFFHDYLRGAVEARYLATDAVREENHRHLASYFQQIIADQIEGGHGVSRQDALELCHQLQVIGMTDDLVETLTTIPILIALWPENANFEVLEYWSWLRKEYDIDDLYRKSLDTWLAGEDDSTEILKAYNLVGRLMNRLGLRDRAVEIYRQSVRTAEESGDAWAEAAARMQIGMVSKDMGKDDVAFDEISRAIATFEELGDQLEAASATGQLGVLYKNRGEYDRALECYQVQEETFRRVGESRRLLVAIGNAGNVHNRKGDHERALECYQEVSELCRDIGDYAGLALALGNSAWILMQRGNLTRAEACYVEQEKICRRLGDDIGAALALNGLGTLASDRGNYPHALELYEESKRMMEKCNNPKGVMVALENIGLVYGKTGEYEKALAAFEEALEISLRLNYLSGRAAILCCIASVHINRGTVDQAEAPLQEALAIRRDLGERLNTIEVLNLIGEMSFRQGELRRGLQVMAEAVEGLRGLDLPHQIRHSLSLTLDMLITLGEQIKTGKEEEQCLADILAHFGRSTSGEGEEWKSLLHLIDDFHNELLKLDTDQSDEEGAHEGALRERIGKLGG